MGISRDDVLHVAHLGRIHLSDEDVAKFVEQLSSIVDYVNKLGQLDTEASSRSPTPCPCGTS